MKQVVQNYRSGELSVLDVPVPACKPGGVLVASRYSLISTGTEMMKVGEAKLSLVGKARARPDHVRKLLDSVAQVGPAAAYKKAVNRLDSYTPLGYSLSGVAIEVGPGAEGFTVGDLVACAGNEHALHAEVNWVPTNLCVPVPEGVDARHAAFGTVGAIALHAVRRAEVELGETACVIGLGLIGQLVVQLLTSAGVRVVGLDPVTARQELAKASGAVATASPSAEGVESLARAIATWTGGLGADHVFLAAGGSSNEPVEMAARLARDRGRLVDIGKCHLDLPWNDYYDKELEVRFSRSYGPGRYDARYELEGIDYPPAYVRWTAKRNLACFLDLLARERVNVAPLVSTTFRVEEAVEVYERLHTGKLDGVGFLFEYARTDQSLREDPRPNDGGVEANGDSASLQVVGRRPVEGAPIRLGFLGAGNYASSMLLPHLATASGVQLAHVATTTSLSAVNAQRRFGFDRASTDAAALLDDESLDAVFIVTRHRSHAELVCKALQRGKAVFVEKPLALSEQELDRVLEVIAATGNDRLMVGFNRRFAPLLATLRERSAPPRGPAIVRYLVNAGPLDAKSWYRDRQGQGSRFEGEGGHFIDTISWWLDALPLEVHAMGSADPDDLVVSIRFDDFSVATIAYITSGNPRYPKETFESAANGRTSRLDNFRRASIWAGRRSRTSYSLAGIDKGQRQQLGAFVAAVRSGCPMPIPLASLVATTRATLAVAKSSASGRPEPL